MNSKTVLSSKAILPALYEKYPDCEYLLPAYFDNPYKILKDPIYTDEWKNKIKKEIINSEKWVVKSLYGREDFDIYKNILESQSRSQENFTNENKDKKDDNSSTNLPDKRDTNHTHNINGAIYQKFSESELLENNFITIGSWTVNGAPVGLNVRESKEKILNNDNSHFVPFLTTSDLGQFEFLSLNDYQIYLREELYIDEWQEWKNIYSKEFIEKVWRKDDWLPNSKGSRYNPPPKKKLSKLKKEKMKSGDKKINNNENIVRKPRTEKI